MDLKTTLIIIFATVSAVETGFIFLLLKKLEPGDDVNIRKVKNKNGILRLIFKRNKDKSNENN